MIKLCDKSQSEITTLNGKLKQSVFVQTKAPKFSVIDHDHMHNSVDYLTCCQNCASKKHL